MLKNIQSIFSTHALGHVGVSIGIDSHLIPCVPSPISGNFSEIEKHVWHNLLISSHAYTYKNEPPCYPACKHYDVRQLKDELK